MKLLTDKQMMCVVGGGGTGATGAQAGAAAGAAAGAEVGGALKAAAVIDGAVGLGVLLVGAGIAIGAAIAAG